MWEGRPSTNFKENMVKQIKQIIKLFSLSFILISLAVPFLVLGEEDKSSSSPFAGARVAEEGPSLHFFWARACPFCEEQKVFLKEIESKYPDLNIYQYSIQEPGNIDILKELMEGHPGSERYLGSVPLTFIGEDFFVGFSKDIGNRIENSIKKYYEEIGEEIEGINEEKEIFYLPVLGEIDPQKWSLGLLAAVIGSIDGFNVCSLGALIVILLLVFALQSRKLTLIFGGLFIFVTVVVYGFLVFLWHQLFSILLPYMFLMRLVIGLAAFFGGIYFLKQFFRFKKHGPVCQIGESKIITSLTKKLESFFKERRNIFFLLGGVILFAAIVTIIEFPCSAVFPVVFTGILAQANLPLLNSLFYIVVYLFFYMLDELAVFLVAVFTRKIWIASGPFMTWMSFAGALVLFFLAYYYFFVL